ncbi:MAG: lipase maturation factor family protein [Gammaproteobacteria bacterium]|nr:MAG: lipase maturation factor family protein [Gammaproteobacteria bacterium]
MMTNRISNFFSTADEYRLTSWLFLKFLALIYFVAFLSLAVQISGLAGPNGLLPFNELLTNTYRDTGPNAWWLIPNVFWLDASDTALTGAAYAGVILAALLFIGRFQFFSLAGMFILYLSLFYAGGIFLSFQWDTLLLETGFLAIFLIRSPTGLIIFLYHWLLFRFRFMSGFFKLESGDPAWSGLTALNYYFETQPLPHIGSWYMQQLPEIVLKAGVLLTFATELIIPFFIFLPRRYRLFAAGITIFMQLLIIATSNHNFVNLLIILLSLFLLDDRIVERLLPARLQRRILDQGKAVTYPVKILLSLSAVLILSASLTTFYWRTTGNTVPAVIAKLTTITHRYGIGNIFHIFPTMQTERQELEIQGSYDGRNWQSYIFKYKPGPIARAPRFNVPHQPRLDWMMWFIPPQSSMDDYWFQQLLRRLREGSPQVLSLLEYNPFKERPPRYLRVLSYRYHFTTPEQRKQTGNWWTREYLGVFPHVKPRRP